MSIVYRKVVGPSQEITSGDFSRGVKKPRPKSNPFLEQVLGGFGGNYLGLPALVTSVAVALQTAGRTFRYKRSGVPGKVMRRVEEEYGERVKNIVEVGSTNGRICYKVVTVEGRSYEALVRRNGSKVLSLRSA